MPPDPVVHKRPGARREKAEQEMTDTVNTTPTTTPDSALRQDWTPVVLGFGWQTRTGKRVVGGKLHLGRPDADLYGMYVRCERDHKLRIAKPEAIVPATDDHGGTHEHLMLGALLTLNLHANQFCTLCFPKDVIETYLHARANGSGPKLVEALRWEHETAQARRTVTVSADAAAVIAYEVAFTTDRQARRDPTPEQGTAEHTVTVSGHADALIAGLVGPPDLGDTNVDDDRERVWHQGIFATNTTWAEAQAAFPLSLYTRRDLSQVDMDAVWAEIRQAFPLAVFRAWADKTLEFHHTGTSPLLGEYSEPLLDHYYDPLAGT